MGCIWNIQSKEINNIMLVVVRNFNNVPVTNFSFQPEHYSWSSLGGPETALVKVSGPHAALRYCLDMLRFTVEIYDDRANLVWWGIINKVVLQDDATRITRSLQSYANTIGAFYTDSDGNEQFMGWVQTDLTEKYNRYGEKQVLIQVSDVIKNEISNSEMLEVLEHFENIPPTMETSRGDTIGATFECVGWGHTLEWQHTPYQDRGKYGHTNNYVSEQGTLYINVSDTAASVEEGQLAQFANFGMTDYVDAGTDAQFISHINIPMRHVSGGVTGTVRPSAIRVSGITLNLYESNGRDPDDADDNLAAPGDFFSVSAGVSEEEVSQALGPPDRTGNFQDLMFSWPTGTQTLPLDGWFFVIHSGDHYLQVPISEEPYWGTPGDPPTNKFLWHRDKNTNDTFSAWDDYTDYGNVTRNWINIPFEFYTRLGASALISHIIKDHSIIRSALYPYPPAVDEKFSAYLNGRETMASSIRNICAVDDLFYIITPNRTLKLYEVPSVPEESNIVMRNDGTISIRPKGDLSKIVGKWVYENSTRGIRGLCTAARYEVRTGAYDLSFRGAPSLSEISTRVLQ